MGAAASILLGWMIVGCFCGCSNQSMDRFNSGVDSTVSSTATTPLTADTALLKPDLPKIYAQAIGDYIRFVHQEYALTFDTLFFGKRQFGQADDFPDIQLPDTIEHTYIKLIHPEEGEKIQAKRKSSYYINLMGWVNSYNAEFIFVAFSNGFAHQFDCTIHYSYNMEKHAFEVDHSQFKNFRYVKLGAV